MEKMKNYQEPTMRVVKLQQRGFLLQSGPNEAPKMRGIDKDFEE